MHRPNPHHSRNIDLRNKIKRSQLPVRKLLVVVENVPEKINEESLRLAADISGGVSTEVNYDAERKSCSVKFMSEEEAIKFYNVINQKEVSGHILRCKSPKYTPVI